MEEYRCWELLEVAKSGKRPIGQTGGRGVPVQRPVVIMVDTPDTERVLERDLVAGHPRSPTIVTHKPVQLMVISAIGVIGLFAVRPVVGDNKHDHVTVIHHNMAARFAKKIQQTRKLVILNLVLLMECWETGGFGINVQRPVKVTGNEPGHVFLRQTVEHRAEEVQPKQKSVAPNTVQLMVC